MDAIPKTPLETLARLHPGATCLCCGLPAHILGVFEPVDPETWGAPKGKTRVFLYRLCAQCRVRPDINEIVEKVLWYEHK